MSGFRYILVSVAGVLSAMVTLLQKYKLMKVNAWTLNLYIGLLGATVTGTISLATEDITFPTDVDNIIYITIQVSVSIANGALTLPDIETDTDADKLAQNPMWIRIGDCLCAVWTPPHLRYKQD